MHTQFQSDVARAAAPFKTKLRSIAGGGSGQAVGEFWRKPESNETQKAINIRLATEQGH